MNTDHGSPAHPLHYAEPVLSNPGGASPAQIAGLLGMASSFVGLAIFVAACFGLEASLLFSPLPLILALFGFLITFFGGFFFKGQSEDTHLVAAMFINLFGLVGALLELSAWLRWSIFMKTGA
jgi:hypothetical protein